LFHNIEELLSSSGRGTIGGTIGHGSISGIGVGLGFFFLLNLFVIGELKISGEVLGGGNGKPDHLKGETVGGLGLSLKVSVLPCLGSGWACVVPALPVGVNRALVTGRGLPGGKTNECEADKSGALGCANSNLFDQVTLLEESLKEECGPAVDTPGGKHLARVSVGLVSN